MSWVPIREIPLDTPVRGTKLRGAKALPADPQQENMIKKWGDIFMQLMPDGEWHPAFFQPTHFWRD